jgi:hypothetical protein
MSDSILDYTGRVRGALLGFRGMGVFDSVFYVFILCLFHLIWAVGVMLAGKQKQTASSFLSNIKKESALGVISPSGSQFSVHRSAGTTSANFISESSYTNTSAVCDTVSAFTSLLRRWVSSVQAFMISFDVITFCMEALESLQCPLQMHTAILVFQTVIVV